jgi:prepilin-type N-terminal cleavage/methylation domain-containing protein
MICRFKKGFSLVEVMAVVAVLMVLAGMVLGLGKRLQDQAKEKLAQSTIDILVTAVEMYYANAGEFPFESSGLDSTGLEDAVGAVAGTLDISKRDSGTPLSLAEIAAIKELSGEFDWSGPALYSRLVRSLDSKKIVGAMDDSVFSANYVGYGYLDLAFADPASGLPINSALIRFVDPWGNAYRYSYVAGNAFAVIDSAGADGKFGTGDDLSSK